MQTVQPKQGAASIGSASKKFQLALHWSAIYLSRIIASDLVASSRQKSPGRHSILKQYLSQQQDTCLIQGWNMFKVEESLHIQDRPPSNISVSEVTTPTNLRVNALVCLPEKPMGGYSIPNSWSLAPNGYPSSSASHPPLCCFSSLFRRLSERSPQPEVSPTVFQTESELPLST